MDTQTTENDVVIASNEGEAANNESDVITVAKKDYETLNQTLGSLKRELKDLKKAKEQAVETPQKNKPEDNGLLQKSFLRAAGISDAEEVELALSTAKKWGVEVDQLVDDEDFKIKLDKIRTNKANAVAASNVRGGNGGVQAKLTPEYWIEKGVPPTPADVPDKKTRGAIIQTLMKNAKGGSGTFYND